MDRAEVSRRLGSVQRRSDTRNWRYLSRHLHLAENEGVEQGTDTSLVTTLRRILLGDLPSRVESHLTEIIRTMRLTGPSLLTRLQALRERYRLSVPQSPERIQAEPTVVRVVCSDGVAG